MPHTRRHTIRRRDPHTGRFVKTYTLTYNDHTGAHTRHLTARGIETLGRLLNRAGARGEAWDIAVHNAHDHDVTFDFSCFT